MNAHEHLPPDPGVTQRMEPPGGMLSIDLIRQLANKIYGEGIVDAPPEPPDTRTPQPPLPGTEQAPTDPADAHRAAGYHPADRASTVGRQAQTAERPGPQPDFSENNTTSNWPASNEQDFYFLQSAETSPATRPSSPAPPGSGLLDLSGEQCPLAPILPKILPAQTAEAVIAAAGRPVDNLAMASHLAQELMARQPYAAQPFTDQAMMVQQFAGAPAEPPKAPLLPADQGLYFHQMPAAPPAGPDLYFQPTQGAAPTGSGLYFEQYAQPQPPYPGQHQRPPEPPAEHLPATQERDWSAYRMFHPETVRRDFPVLQQTVHGKPLVWLDNAATTQKPWAVINALKRFYERDNSNIHRGAHTLAARATDAYEEAREKIRQFIGAGSKDEILYVRGTTEGINLVANTFGRQRVGPGDEIILSELEHHANIVPWQMLAQEKGARLRVIPINSRGDIMLGEYERLFNPRTRIVALGQVSNALGTVVPVQEMIATAHRRGVPVMVDGAQSVQHMTVNVQELDADFFVFSGHKLFAPTGIGVVYGKREHLEQMPPWQGGGNMIETVTFEETTYNGIPAKFEAGTPSIGDAIGLGAAIDYVQKIGMENIHRYEEELMEYLVWSLTDIPGLQLIGNPTHRAGAVSFVLKNIPTNTVGQLLDREGIAVRSGHHCAQPALRHFGYDSSVRPSLAFYNLREDVDRLREALLKIV